jgi:hypothetical protein
VSAARSAIVDGEPDDVIREIDWIGAALATREGEGPPDAELVLLLVELSMFRGNDPTVRTAVEPKLIDALRDSRLDTTLRWELFLALIRWEPRVERRTALFRQIRDDADESFRPVLDRFAAGLVSIGRISSAD